MQQRLTSFTLCFEIVDIQKINGGFSLQSEVAQHVTFMHGRYRMNAHYGVPVDAIGLASVSREKMTSKSVAFKLWCANDERSPLLTEHAQSNLGRAPNAADIGT